MMIYIIPAVLALIGFGAGYYLRKMLAEKDNISLAEHESLKQQMNATLVAHATEVTRLRTELQFQQEKLELQKKELEHIGEKFESQFKVLANSILEDKAEKFSRQQEQQMKTILDPLKEHINTFKKDYETKQHRESEERISLKEQIKHMMELNRNLSQQAEDLTTALRGNVKQQGNWGEMILETMLQYAGLQKDYHYFVQEQSKNHEGQTIQPDIIVRYPDDRNIVIDAKVSLVHYEYYCAAKGKEEQATALNAMVRSVKSHIDGLSAKSYQDVAGALDFVMMFVPVESAYITAMQADVSLWQYAYSRKILLISPTNLVAAMKLIADMWQRDGINKEAHFIAEKAGKLYDKLVLFVENFEKVGLQLQRAQDSWQSAFRQLSHGKGNMISQAEQMKRYNAKASKSLPSYIAEEALIEDRKVLPEEE